MSIISLRLPAELLDETKAHSKALHISQNEYIRRAIEHLNSEFRKKELAKKLKNTSLKVRAESSRVNDEFSEIEDDPTL